MQSGMEAVARRGRRVIGSVDGSSWVVDRLWNLAATKPGDRVSVCEGSIRSVAAPCREVASVEVGSRRTLNDLVWQPGRGRRERLGEPSGNAKQVGPVRKHGADLTG